VNARLDQLEAMLSDGPYAVGNAFTLADCAVVPTMFFMTFMLPMLGTSSPTERRPKLTAWWTKVQERPAVQKVLGEQREGLLHMQRTGRPS
jgi:glutathione S-transferase